LLLVELPEDELVIEIEDDEDFVMAPVDSDGRNKLCGVAARLLQDGGID
jgi:hypothetical protein